MLEIVDTLPAFLAFWEAARELDQEDQIERWAVEYLEPWPELFEIQAADYREQGLDWRVIARTRIFPYLEDRLQSMARARTRLLQVLPEVAARVEARYGSLGDLLCVLHVGLGCGAGWACTLLGRPAVLFGLENIAECGWTTREALQGLAAHEFGHLLLQAYREGAGLELGEGPLWQLFEEGFAQHVAVDTTDTWHLACGSIGGEWLAWCQRQLPRLAARYLDDIENNRPVNAYFGSWLEVDGHSQTGIYLGYELLQLHTRELSLNEVAQQTDVEAHSLRLLRELAVGV